MVHYLFCKSGFLYISLAYHICDIDRYIDINISHQHLTNCSIIKLHELIIVITCLYFLKDVFVKQLRDTILIQNIEVFYQNIFRAFIHSDSLAALDVDFSNLIQ